MSVKIRGIVQKFAGLIDTLRYKSDLVKFSDLSSNLEACLICMPSRLELMRAASDILPEIAEIFPNREIRILLTSNVDPQSHDIIKKFVVVKPHSYDLDKFSLPKKEFIQRVSTGGLAVSVDLDTYPNFFNAVVSLRSGATVRTAFDKGIGLPYYNLIVGIPAAEAAPKVSCRAMADILGNFRM
ncbi:MAG: hypothetical protein V3S06_06210 [candidate division Zixibacteria bacterium]